MNISKAKYEQYANDPEVYRDEKSVDVNGSVRRFGDVMDPWQRKDFAALDKGLMLCNGQSKDTNCIKRAYFERSRGHSKTTDIAVVCCWALAFATRPIRGYAFAADKDQSALLKDAMATIIRLNPWLSKILEVQKNQVVNIAKGHPGNGASIEIAASDVGSSYGILPDFIVADELTHWPDNAEALWHSIISSAAKRSNCFLFTIANAGFVDSWQWHVRETARTDDAWYFSRLDGPVASWLTEEVLAEQRRMLPPMAYNRLWQNEWSNAGGDALTPEVIDRAFVDDLQPATRPDPSMFYIAGVDLGLVRDGSAVVVLGVPADGGAGRITLCHHKLWRPVNGQKIDLLDIERHLLQLDELFGLEFLGFDPWQAEHLGQTLEADTSHRRRNQRRHYSHQPWVREVPPTPSNLRQMASHTIEFFNDGRIQLFDCEPLRRDLHKLRVEEKSYGFRLVSPRDGEGHGDSFSAFAIALLLAHEVAGVRRLRIQDMFTAHYTKPEEHFARRQEQYQREQQWLAQPDTNDPSGLLWAMRSGRANIIK